VLRAVSQLVTRTVTTRRWVSGGCFTSPSQMSRLHCTTQYRPRYVRRIKIICTNSHTDVRNRVYKPGVYEVNNSNNNLTTNLINKSECMCVCVCVCLYVPD
jgi:hypothetical protein